MEMDPALLDTIALLAHPSQGLVPLVNIVQALVYLPSKGIALLATIASQLRRLLLQWIISKAMFVQEDFIAQQALSLQ